MLSKLRRAYRGGWRAGMAGGDWRSNPFRNLILRALWDAGWQTGIKRRLNQWLATSRKGF